MFMIKKIGDLKKTSFSYLMRKYGNVAVLNYKMEIKHFGARNTWGEFYLYDTVRKYNSWMGMCNVTNYIKNKYPNGYVAFSDDEVYSSKRYV